MNGTMQDLEEEGTVVKEEGTVVKEEGTVVKEEGTVPVKPEPSPPLSFYVNHPYRHCLRFYSFSS